MIAVGANPILSLNTNFGPIVMELFERRTPGTVNNFLNYVNDGDYIDSFFHVSSKIDDGSDFVIQAGGYTSDSTQYSSFEQFLPVPRDPPIANEPGISNLRGTVAMAKTRVPDSATSHFFVNLNDNSSFLDNPRNSGGFTVFAQVLDLNTVDVIAALPVVDLRHAPFGDLPISADNELVVIQAIEGTGSIIGTRFFDQNHNGVRDETEPGVPSSRIFVDSNTNGVFDSGERFTVSDSNGQYRLDVDPGDYLIVAELAESSSSGSLFATNVNVEIGREIRADLSGSLTFDFGDSLDFNYPTSFANDGARHVISALTLGDSVDREADGLVSLDANGDGTDDDGVMVVASMVAANSVDTKSSFYVTASGVGKLDAWIDLNRDGDWDDHDEQIARSMDVVPGANFLSFTVPADAVPGNTYARFRISSAGGLRPGGFAADGEVEDYLLRILDGDSAGESSVEVKSPISENVDVRIDGSEIVVQSGLLEVFRAPRTLQNQIEILGNGGDNVLNVRDADEIFQALIRVNSGLGNDTLRLIGNGQSLDLTQIPDEDIQGLEVIDITGDGANVLMLDVSETINISPTTDTLRVQHDDDDTVSFGDGWTVNKPQLISNQLVHILTSGDAKLEVVNDRAYRNPALPLDMNLDGSVTPLDALIGINTLNDLGSRALPAPTSIDSNEDYFYLDPTGDGWLSALDILVVTNFLNDVIGNAEGEGQSRLVAFNAITSEQQRDDASFDILVRTTQIPLQEEKSPGTDRYTMHDISRSERQDRRQQFREEEIDNALIELLDDLDEVGLDDASI